MSAEYMGYCGHGIIIPTLSCDIMISRKRPIACVALGARVNKIMLAVLREMYS